ncbi:MAG: SGNH/GDSL hydrolase family protein [Candidatus Zixiibacteriota bacterium]|nr:MAG: SGNH/GDSL hydrolase family protein [candidate division Zixibacteria bacterium]
MNKANSGSGIGCKLVILILSIPALILLSEIILTIIPLNTFFENRFFLVNRALDYPEIFRKDPRLFWRFRPSQDITSRFFEGETIRINSHGLRGEEIPLKSDKIRIAALGNSCTFGWGVTEDQTYVRLLEKMINNDDSLPRVEVINAGIPGYSTFQGRRFFVSDIARLQPDIVMMMFGWNDQWAAAENIADKDQKLPSESIIKLQNSVSRLKIYRLLRKVILWITEKPLEKALVRTERPVYRVAFVDFYQNLMVIFKFAHAEGMRLMILTSPIPSLEVYYPAGFQSPMHEYHETYNMQARLLARNSKSPLINLTSIFDQHNDLFDDAIRDPIHFNAKGHHVIAEAIYRHFKEHPELLVSGDEIEPEPSPLRPGPKRN